MRTLIGLIGVLMALPAMAAEVAVTPEACRWMTQHVPAPDVKYRPDVDVHGKALVPVEIPSASGVKLPERIYVPLTVELGSFLGFTAPVVKAEGFLGLLAMGPEGLTFNGRPVKNGAALAALCR